MTTTTSPMSQAIPFRFRTAVWPMMQRARELSILRRHLRDVLQRSIESRPRFAMSTVSTCPRLFVPLLNLLGRHDHQADVVFVSGATTNPSPSCSSMAAPRPPNRASTLDCRKSSSSSTAVVENISTKSSPPSRQQRAAAR
mmetsp:Transcript_6720/g.20914  ORF Transcript_6720/g.20914 Transcript_6720/m.20914 type:complete len:141 (-) Transcript_6720:62-484(-)